MGNSSGKSESRSSQPSKSSKSRAPAHSAESLRSVSGVSLSDLMMAGDRSRGGSGSGGGSYRGSSPMPAFTPRGMSKDNSVRALPALDDVCLSLTRLSDPLIV